MTKADLLKALEPFELTDHLALDELIVPYVPRIRTICGARQSFTCYYCALPPGHEGAHWCDCKDVEFESDDDE